MANVSKCHELFADLQHNIPMMMSDGAADGAGVRPLVLNFRGASAVQVSVVSSAPEFKIRTEFPETFIYESFANFGLVSDFVRFLLSFLCVLPPKLLSAQFFVLTISYKIILLTLIPLGEHYFQRPMALAASLPGVAHFRGGVKKKKITTQVKVAETVEPVIRSSFPESFIFDDFPE